MPIDQISIYNFKSIQSLENFKIKPINVLIGANGSGKSNFIQFFKLLHYIYNQKLKYYVANNGYAEKLLYMGRKKSFFLGGEIIFRSDEDKNINNAYKFRLVPQSDDEGFYFEYDQAGYYNVFSKRYNEKLDYKNLGSEGRQESRLKENSLLRADFLRYYFNSFRIFHFHDTSSNSPLKQPCQVEDNEFLREDGANLPAFLYAISQTSEFKMIEYVIQSIAPFFGRFNLRPNRDNKNYISLNWIHRNSDHYFNAHSLSDGTLRFIALITLLLQPEPPKTIIIDEPELGLHPAAIYKLAEIVKMVSQESQIIISTQSPYLIDEFDPENIIITERENNQSIFKRLSKQNLQKWLDEYTLSQLWTKNIIGGLPK
ncbi:MAG: AAA family ATPase [Bacteroidales bacterium]